MFILAITPGLGFEAVNWKALLASGIDAVMIREKQLDAKPLLDLARRVQDLAPHLELWINGRLDVALAAGCGLHAPELYPDVPSVLCRLSRPVHSEAQLAARIGCAQLLLGPIFDVPGKGVPWGVERIHRVLDEIPKGPRVLALGGITSMNAAALLHPRLDGIALIRALRNTPDPARLVEAFRRSWA